MPLYLTRATLRRYSGPPMRSRPSRSASGVSRGVRWRTLRGAGYGLRTGLSPTWRHPISGSASPGASSTSHSPEGTAFVVCLFDAEKAELAAVVEADLLGRLRTGAASGVASRHLARRGATTLGVIGCGHQAETQVACIRAAVPGLERVVAYCRTPERLAGFCERVGAEPGETHGDAGAQDVVVTITSSRDPVLRGEWLRAGALVVAAGANVASRRELDNAVLERASFVCCDSRAQAQLESGDLVEPISGRSARLARGTRAPRGRLG